MSEHPYRAPITPPARRRAKVEPWAVVLAALWLVAVARSVAVFFDHSLSGPITGLCVALAVGIPTIAANARVLAGARDDA